MMIILKIIIAICLFSGIFFFFWYLQRTKIIEKSLTAARGSIKETTARRQVEAHANLLIRDKKNKTRLEKIIENPEKLYTYSRIGKIVRGLSFEAWAVLVVLTTAGAYLGTLIVTKNTMTGLLAAVGYFLSLMQDLSDLQVTDIDLTGSTMTDAGYGNAVYLQITCKLPIEQLNMDGNDMLRFFFEDGTIPIRVRRMSTAKN